MAVLLTAALFSRKLKILFLKYNFIQLFCVYMYFQA